MCKSRAKFHVGQLVQHNKFGYRGVVIDVDPNFQGTEHWYDKVAQSKPPKNKPWYRVLVDDQDSETYVAERHLEPDAFGGPVAHPYIEVFFDEFENSKYVSKNMYN